MTRGGIGIDCDGRVSFVREFGERLVEFDGDVSEHDCLCACVGLFMCVCV